MIRTILVALDGSPLAERSLPYACALARSAGARIVLMGAALASGGNEGPVQAELDRLAGYLRLAGLAAEARVYFAAAEEAILDASHRERADLIVMSTHGRAGVERWLYGSVADAVLRSSDVPMLVIPAACARDWPSDHAPRFLIALDGSPLAEAVLTPTGTLAAALGAELHLLRVVAPPMVTAEPGLYAHLFDSDTELAEAREYLEQIADDTWAAGCSVTAHVEVGPPTGLLVEYAREHQMDLIAMATHGRGGLARVLMGSVATGVLQRAGMPMLLVRPTSVRQPVNASASVTLI
jgi:nucleotide-binding universal stress UspA family protein